MTATLLRGYADGKVTSVAGAGTFILRFTSVDPEATRVLDEALAR